uniref:Zinc metalloprotease n=1 Tax=Desulfatirhabdium butyrativorans TaxID=340467 RepID=A0A7C4RSF1_9BACT
MTSNIVSFAIVLGVLIFFHELGHFLMARVFGVGVQIFSLGFGPRLLGKTVGRTDYRISAVPLGGYVKMVGEEPDAEIPPEDIPFSFSHKKLLPRFVIVAAGPTFNLILAVLIFFGVFLYSGIFYFKPHIGGVDPDGPAARAGIRSQDTVVAIDGVAVDSWEAMSERILNSKGRPLSITIEREGETRTVDVQPSRRTVKNLFGEDSERYVIGITASGMTASKRIGIGEAVVESVGQTWKIARLTVMSVVKLIDGTLSPKTLGGPILIAEMAGQQAREGAENLIYFIAVISINLAILNFLPIPVLDGGHLLFFLIEAVTRKPLSIRTREVANQVGIFLLVLLMAFVFYNDLTRIFFETSR